MALEISDKRLEIHLSELIIDSDFDEPQIEYCKAIGLDGFTVQL